MMRVSRPVSRKDQILLHRAPLFSSLLRTYCYRRFARLGRSGPGKERARILPRKQELENDCISQLFAGVSADDVSRGSCMTGLEECWTLETGLRSSVVLLTAMALGWALGPYVTLWPQLAREHASSIKLGVLLGDSLATYRGYGPT